MAHRDATAHVVRRLRWLRNWEAVNVVLMPAVFTAFWLRGDGAVAWWVRLPALALVSWLLAQGTLYWHLKLRNVRERRPLPPWFCPVFRRLRASAVAGFLLAAAVAVAGPLVGGAGAGDAGWAAFLLGFAALEYANYYHWQLKHDSAADWTYLHRWRRLRRAPLAMDLARHCAERGAR